MPVLTQHGLGPPASEDCLPVLKTYIQQIKGRCLERHGSGTAAYAQHTSWLFTCAGQLPRAPQNHVALAPTRRNAAWHCTHRAAHRPLSMLHPTNSQHANSDHIVACALPRPKHAAHATPSVTHHDTTSCRPSRSRRFTLPMISSWRCWCSAAASRGSWLPHLNRQTFFSRGSMCCSDSTTRALRRGA